MKKEIIIVTLLLAFIFIMKKKAGAIAPVLNEGDSGKERAVDWNQVTVKKGDSISGLLVKWAKQDEKISTQFANLETALKDKRKALLLWTKNVAEANGKEWGLYDDKVSNNPYDPDTLNVGDKLTLFAPENFEDVYTALMDNNMSPNTLPAFLNNLETGTIERIINSPYSWEFTDYGKAQLMAAMRENFDKVFEKYNSTI